MKLYEGVNNTGLAAPHPLPTPSKGLQASGKLLAKSSLPDGLYTLSQGTVYYNFHPIRRLQVP